MINRSTQLLLLLLLTLSCNQKKNVVPGIPLELAIDRKQHVQHILYDLFFDLPESSKDSIHGRATITFDWTKNPNDLQFDFAAEPLRIKLVEVNGNIASPRVENEHILIDKQLLKEGSNTVTITFMAGEGPLNRSNDYLYSLFVPSRASTCFPLFDQPDLKAIFRLELLLPKEWKAISNGKIVSSEDEGDKRRIHFSATRPTSSYQFAFAAGNFKSATDPKSGMTMYYRETDSVKVARNVSRIFELHRQSLSWLENFTLIEYPFEKFDFALMPSFQFGGMEHPGSIFYRESSLFLEPSASVNEELRRASLIAHETAHMWFGNLVTMRWFNDVWLKEVFANFMAAKMVSPSFPELNHDLRFLMAHFPSAYDIDRSEGRHPIQQPLDNLRNAGSVYGAIIYQKAPIMMRNLEAWIGEDQFKQGLRDYLKKFSYQNASWDELVNILKSHTGADLDEWNRAWIKTAGMPEIANTADADGRSSLRVLNDSTGIVWPQTFYYRIAAPALDTVRQITIRNASALLVNSDGPGVKFIPNYKGKGYGYFHASAEYLFDEIPTAKDAEVRAGLWMSVWEIFLRGEISPTDFLNNLLNAVKAEKDPLLLEYLTDKLGRLYWQFLTPNQRGLVADTVDELLFNAMTIEKDNSRKRTLFNAYRNIANSAEGRANLKKFWKDEITLGLEISERDHIQLAYALALREVENYKEILRHQLQEITNPDRKAEMLFILPALSANAEERDLFFERLAKKENRAREPWVLESLRHLHHPLRADQSVKHVMTSLHLLEEIQRTGDIFFPKGWLDATLGEYQSVEAAHAVREYLSENKDLRQDLKNKLLQSSDMLFRAEEIVKKNGLGSRN